MKKISSLFFAVILILAMIPQGTVIVDTASEENIMILVLNSSDNAGWLDDYRYAIQVKQPSALESFVPSNYSVVYVMEGGRPTNDAQRNSLLWALGNGTGVIEDQRCDYYTNKDSTGTHLLGINSTWLGEYQACTMVFNSSNHFIIEPIVDYINMTGLSWGMYSYESYFDESVTPLVDNRTILCYQNESALGIPAPLLVVGEYGQGKVFFMATRPSIHHSTFFQKLFFHRAVAWCSKNKLGVFISPMPNGYDAALSYRFDDLGYNPAIWNKDCEWTLLQEFFQVFFDYGFQGTFATVVMSEWREGNLTRDYYWIKDLLDSDKISLELHGTVDGHVLFAEDPYGNTLKQLEAMYQGCKLYQQIFDYWPIAMMPPAWQSGRQSGSMTTVLGINYDLVHHDQPLITGGSQGNLTWNIAEDGNYTKSVSANATYPDTGGIELTDEKWGDKSDHTDSDWSGYYDTNVSVIVDLDSVLNTGFLWNLSFFRVGFMENQSLNIYYPKNVTFEVSQDNVTWTYVGQGTNNTGNFDLTATAWKVRYVRVNVTASAPNRLLFMDEVRVDHSIDYWRDSPHLPYDRVRFYWGDATSGWSECAGNATIETVWKYLLMTKLRFAHLIALTHPNYCTADWKYNPDDYVCGDLDYVHRTGLNRTKTLASVISQDDGYYWWTDLEEMVEWVKARDYEAKANITSAIYDPSSQKLTVGIEVGSYVSGLTLMIPNAVDLEVQKYYVDGVEHHFVPAAHQDATRVVLPGLSVGSHTIAIYFGNRAQPYIKSTVGWHYPNITASAYATDELSFNISSPQRVNVTIGCLNRGRPYTVKGGVLKSYDETNGEAIIYVYADRVEVLWHVEPPINIYGWGVIAAAGGSFAYWLYRKKRKKSV